MEKARNPGDFCRVLRDSAGRQVLAHLDHNDECDVVLFVRMRIPGVAFASTALAPPMGTKDEAEWFFSLTDEEILAVAGVAVRMFFE